MKSTVRAAKAASIERGGREDEDVAVGTDEASCDPIPMMDMSSIAVQIQTGLITSMTPWASSKKEGPYFPLHSTGQSHGGAYAMVQMTGMAVGGWYEVPTAVFPCHYLKLVSDGAGTIRYMGSK